MTWKTILKKKRWTDEKPVNTGWGGANAKTHAKDLAAKKKKEEKTANFKATPFGASLLELKEAETKFSNVQETTRSRLNDALDVLEEIVDMVKNFDDEGWKEYFNIEGHSNSNFFENIKDLEETTINLTDKQAEDFDMLRRKDGFGATTYETKTSKGSSRKSIEVLTPNWGDTRRNQPTMPSKLNDWGKDYPEEVDGILEDRCEQYNKAYDIFMKTYEGDYLSKEKEVDELRAKHQSLRR